MKCSVTNAILFAVACGVITAGASAAPLVEYQYDPGSLNPNTQGWTYSNFGTLSDNAVDGALTVDDNDGSAPFFRANVGLAGVTDPSGWTLTGRLRVDSQTQKNFGLSLTIDSGSKFWNINFINDVNNPADNGVWTEAPSSQLAPVSDIGAAFHTYQLIDNDGSEATPPELWIDGAATGQFASDGGSFLPDGEVWWGSVSSPALGVSNWKYVAFEVGQHPIPEPSAVVLACAALIGLTVARRRRPRL